MLVGLHVAPTDDEVHVTARFEQHAHDSVLVGLSPEQRRVIACAATGLDEPHQDSAAGVVVGRAHVNSQVRAAAT
jgi:hypothetical protein